MKTEQLPIDFEAARKARDAGMQRAIDHADVVHEEWSEQAFDIAIQYAAKHPSFTTEQLRRHAADKGLPTPPDNRAWGAVLSRLARTGRISKAGYTSSTNRQAHCRPIVIWRSAA